MQQKQDGLGPILPFNPVTLLQLCSLSSLRTVSRRLDSLVEQALRTHSVKEKPKAKRRRLGWPEGWVDSCHPSLLCNQILVSIDT